jgi:hypothetical protein
MFIQMQSSKKFMNSLGKLSCNNSHLKSSVSARNHKKMHSYFHFFARYSFLPKIYLSFVPASKKSSHYITHVAMHYPRDDNSQLEFFNF